MKVLAIAGSYRDGGIIDQAVDVAVRIARNAGAEVDVVRLRDYPIEFCRNCRECTQAPGDAPGECVLNDGMRELVRRIEAADAYILASPTNVYATTALFRRFMERLIVYVDWPWGARAPRLRNKTPGKRALVIASAVAPSVGWAEPLSVSVFDCDVLWPKAGVAIVTSAADSSHSDLLIYLSPAGAMLRSRG